MPGGLSGWRGKRSAITLTWLALAAIVLIQAYPFTFGYRRSADEVMFLTAFLNGWHSIEELTVSLATFQGRLGLLATTPLNTLGAYLSDGYYTRWIFVLLHFGVYALFAAYFSIISATNVTRSLLLFLIALQTICARDDYMPPITYPLQNTLPFIALIAARCAILLVQRHGRRSGRYLLVSARVIFLTAILTTEFAFLLATALLAAEYGFALARQWRDGASTRAALLDVVRQRAFLYDVAIVGFALLAYLAFRWIYPSSYVGNVIDAGLEITRVVETTVRHVLAGTVFARDVFDVGSLPRQALPMATLVGLLTAACSVAVLSEVRALPSPFFIALGSVLAIAYVTFPLAGNARQQVWCVDSGACGYLDSRISYLGFVVIVICISGLVLQRMPTSRTSMAAVAVMSIATGLIAATTYARNLRDGQDMKVEAATWERAGLLACYPEEQPSDADRLLRLIDRGERVRFHPGADKAQFWHDYVRSIRGNRQCPPDNAARRADLQHALEIGAVVGQTIEFRGKPTNQYLGAGWSQPERWGVWSDADRAHLVFLPLFVPRTKVLQVRLVLRPYIRPSVGQQTVSVSVNGQLADTWEFIKGAQVNGCCERILSLGRDLRPGEAVEITFDIHDPRNPEADREIVDNRALGLFLQSMTLVDSAGGGR